jgi:hypothetical protein
MEQGIKQELKSALASVYELCGTAQWYQGITQDACQIVCDNHGIDYGNEVEQVRWDYVNSRIELSSNA